MCRCRSNITTSFQNDIILNFYCIRWWYVNTTLSKAWIWSNYKCFHVQIFFNSMTCKYLRISKCNSFSVCYTINVKHISKTAFFNNHLVFRNVFLTMNTNISIHSEKNVLQCLPTVRWQRFLSWQNVFHYCSLYTSSAVLIKENSLDSIRGFKRYLQEFLGFPILILLS